MDVELIVQYRIRNIEAYLFNVSEQTQAVHSVAEAALRQVIGQHPIDESLTEGKLAIQEQIHLQIFILLLMLEDVECLRQKE